jgi:hypothetical protein
MPELHTQPYNPDKGYIEQIWNVQQWLLLNPLQTCLQAVLGVSCRYAYDSRVVLDEVLEVGT